MIESFLPISFPNSKLLILGSIPGIPSLTVQEYYGNKKNAFWRILFTLFLTEYSDFYPHKIRLLQQNKIALWDTVKYCERKGSLDSAIRKVEPNDISSFLAQNSNIQAIAFNGKNAEKYFYQYNKSITHVELMSLPSTSPANAGLKLEQKLEQWKIILNFL